MTKLIHSRKVEKKIKEVMKDKFFATHEKADEYVMDGFKKFEIFEVGFNFALKAKEKKCNAYYAFDDDCLLFFMGEKESDVLDRISNWKNE